LYTELKLADQLARSHFNSLAELLIDVWRNDQEHKDGLKLIPLWNAIDKARVSSGHSRYHKIIKIHGMLLMAEKFYEHFV
jgi:predicted metal-dependent hydrolase